MIVGFVRKLDNLNRLVIPKPYTKVLGLGKNEKMEMLIEDSKLIVKKYQPCCTICGTKEELVELAGTKICKKCLAEANKKFNC